MVRLAFITTALLILGTTWLGAEPACQSTQSVTLCKSRPGCAWVPAAKGKKGGKCVPAKVAPR